MRSRALLAALCAAASAQAGAALSQDPLGAQLAGIAKAWATANYATTDAHQRASAEARVVDQAHAVAAAHPGRAEPMVWEAIALSTEAGARRDLYGLRLAARARDLLDQARQIDSNALADGSIPATLGELYAKVPGFPVGFGDQAKARVYLLQAIALNPTGLCPNLYYGDYLLHNGDPVGARQALSRALQARPRPGRELEDGAMRAQASRLLQEAERTAR